MIIKKDRCQRLPNISTSSKASGNFVNVKVVQNVLVDMANNDRVELSRSCDILFRSHVLSLRSLFVFVEKYRYWQYPH